MKTKTIMLFVALLILLVGVASASEVSDDTNGISDTSDVSGDMISTGSSPVVSEDTTVMPQIAAKNATSKKETKQIAKEEKNSKTASYSYDVNDWSTLSTALTSDSYDNVTVNIISDIKLEESTTLNERIKNLTINGNHKTIKGDQYRFLNITSGQSVTIENISIESCYSEEGGAIYNNGNLTIKNSDFLYNHAINGGVIYNTKNSNVSVTGSNFFSNSAYSSNLYALGGAIYNGGTFNITDSTFTGNVAQGLKVDNDVFPPVIDYSYGYGGAIFNYGDFNIKGSNLTHNQAAQGGAIYNQGTIIITDSNLNNNTASGTGWYGVDEGRGGAIFNHGGWYLTITDSNLTYNTAGEYGGAIANNYRCTLTMANSNLICNTAGEYGGAIANKGNVNCTDSTFYNNDPANYIVTENNGEYYLKLDKSDDFINMNSVCLFIDDGSTPRYSGSNLDEYCLPAGIYTIKLVVNGTDQTKFNMNTFILEAQIERDELWVSGYPALVSAVEYAKTTTYDIITINLLPGDYNATDNMIWADATGSTRNLTINGNGFTLDGINVHQFMYVNSGYSLTLENITLTNYTANDGGAIDNNGTLTLNNITLENNHAKENGGAIFNNRSANLTITDSRLNYNQAESGGAITNCNYGRITLTNTNLTHNNASYEGGAIYNNQTGTLTMRDVILEYNTAYTSGVIYNNGTVNVTKATFSYNNASGFSGGVLENDGTFTITESCFNNNTADWSGGAIDNNGKLTINDTSFEYNTADINGGAIVNYADLILDNATFKYNAASRGGAISNGGILDISSYSLFENNNARSNGGAIYNSGNLTIKTTTLNNNTAEVTGGAIYNDNAKLTINDTNITYNEAGTGGAIYNVNNELSDGTTKNAKGAATPSIPKADDETITETTVTIISSRINNNNAVYGGAIKNVGIMNITDNTELNNNTASVEGGAIETSGYLSITRSILKNNTASDNGGAIKNIVEIIIGPIWDSTRYASRALTNQENPEGAESIYDSILIIADTTLEYNNAGGDGGAIYNDDDAITTIINSKLNNNRANRGGAIESDGTLNITESTFDDNTASCGGAIDIFDLLLITHTSLTNNNAFAGGAIYFEGEILNITHCTIDNNKASYTSGAIYISEGGTIDINDTSICNNRANESAGAINNNEGILTINNSALNNNTVSSIESLSFSDCSGGAICNNYGDLSVINSTLNNNNVRGLYTQGGAIYNAYGDLSIINTTLNNNNVSGLGTIGGAICNRYGSLTVSNNSHIENNNAIEGGAVSNYNGMLNFTNVTLNNNTASNGGAIYNYIDSFILGIGLNDNIAIEDDIINEDSVTILDSILNNNTADYGGAILNKYGIMTMNNTCLESNNAEYGGAIENDFGTLAMTNTNLTKNIATISGGAIFNTVYALEESGGHYGDSYESKEKVIKSIKSPETYDDERGEGYADIVLIDCNLKDNEATYGGAILNNAWKMIKEDSFYGTARHNNAFTMNREDIIPSTASGLLSQVRDGKLITAKGSSSEDTEECHAIINITGGSFENNNAKQSGGAISNYVGIMNTDDSDEVIVVSDGDDFDDTKGCYCFVTINATTLKNNTALFGGALYNHGNNANLSIIGSQMDNNSAITGGAIFNENATLNINTTTLSNNTAASGAAIHNTANATIYNNTFKTNKATSGESAIVDNAGTAEIRDNINDKTSRYYSTIYTMGDDVSIIKNIFDDGIINTTIIITTNSSTPYVGDKIQIKFTLKENKTNNPIANQIINITIDGKTYNPTTNNQGIATVNHTINSTLTKVTAKFDENYPYNSSNASLNITAKKISTQLAISVSNSTPLNNTSINVTATLTADNKKLANQNVTLNINGKNYNLKTNSNGVVTQSYMPTTLGTQTITATYNGNNQYINSTNKTSITVKKLNTKLVVKVSNNTPVNSTAITITATLTDVNGNKLANQNITISVGGKTFTNKTNANGVVTQSYTPTKVETQTVTATYNGSDKYNNSTATTSITVKKINTKLSVKTSNATPVNSTPINITVTLTDEGGNKLSGQNVTITVGGKTFNGKTNTNGVATQSYTPVKVEKQTITATYNGDSQYVNTTASTSITVKKINTKLTVNASNTSPVLNASINITATLTDASGNKLSGQNVTLTVGGKTYTVKTNSNGVAIQSYTPTKVETQKITATYNGDSKYTGSTATSNITVRKIDTKLTLKVSNSTPVNNTQISITATLTDANNNKLANQVVTLNVNGKTYNVTTNKDGVAMLNYTPTKVESQTITATYKGNSQDNNSTATTKITVINKYNTKVTMTHASGVIGEKLTLKATVFDQNNAKVTDGNVIFKINGVTIKDNGKLSGSSNPLKVKVVNGVATATITPDVSMKSAFTITASYVGTDIYNKSTSSPVNITISPRNATIEITLSKKIIKQGQVLTITARVYDTTNGKKSTNLTAYPDEYVFFKVNGITLKDANNQTIKVKLVNGVATINYTVPLGIAGIMDCKTMAVKNHTIVAGYYNKNYDTVSQTPTFQVERSNLTLVISNVTANNKTHKLSLKVTVRDYLGNVVEGPNKFIIKLNGFSITNGTEPMYYYSVDGILSISNIDIPVYNVYNYVEVVTQDRLAYTSQRNTTTKIKVLN